MRIRVFDRDSNKNNPCNIPRLENRTREYRVPTNESCSLEQNTSFLNDLDGDQGTGPKFGLQSGHSKNNVSRNISHVNNLGHDNHDK